MIAVGMAVIWAGYSVAIWGYCLVRSYNVRFGQVFGSRWPGTSRPAAA